MSIHRSNKRSIMELFRTRRNALATQTVQGNSFNIAYVNDNEEGIWEYVFDNPNQPDEYTQRQMPANEKPKLLRTLCSALNAEVMRNAELDADIQVVRLQGGEPTFLMRGAM